MPIRFVQFRHADGARAVARVSDNGEARRVNGATSTWSLAMAAIDAGQSLEQAAAARGVGERVELHSAATEQRLLPPIDHADPAHLYLTGTGLTHLGSAEGRDKMHRRIESGGGQLTDSMKMFQMGLQGGKPGPGEAGVQPEWFYKGDGSSVVATGEPLVAPHFALDGSEEPEICGIYITGKDGVVHRLGFCLANEFSDHVMERQNYLYLAHCKLRPAALGAELLTGPLPDDIRGASRIRRDGVVLWEKSFLSGESNMSHTIANLEQHHFKYALFRRPGDVHVHFFGTATLSFTDGIETRAGDVFEIEAAPFLLPLRNTLAKAGEATVRVAML